MKPVITNHGSEIILLGIIAIGVMILAGFAINANNAGEASAWTAVLMAIIGAIKERWMQRSADAANAMLHASKPDPQSAGQTSVDTEEEK